MLDLRERILAASDTDEGTREEVACRCLSTHKHDATLRLIEQAGVAVRFLPAYSPDLNPIERTWSKVGVDLMMTALVEQSRRASRR